MGTIKLNNKTALSSENNVGLSRTHHTAVAWKDSIFIFGGCLSNDSTSELPGNGNGLNDMISFNITERVWKVMMLIDLYIFLYLPNILFKYVHKLLLHLLMLSNFSF